MDSAPTSPTESLTGSDTAKYAFETGILPPPRKRPKPLYARTHGASKGRMEKIEDLLHPLIKLGRVKVIRRKFAPPLVKWTPSEPIVESAAKKPEPQQPV